MKVKFIAIFLVILFSSNVFASSAQEFCKNPIKDQTFYKTMRSAPRAYYYNFDDVENNRFSKIQDVLDKNLEALCSKNADFSTIVSSNARACEMACIKEGEKFKQTIFKDPSKDKQYFIDDCQTTCMVTTDKFTIYQQMMSESNRESCNKDAISNLGRSMKDIESAIPSGAEKKSPFNSSK